MGMEIGHFWSPGKWRFSFKADRGLPQMELFEAENNASPGNCEGNVQFVWWSLPKSTSRYIEYDSAESGHAEAAVVLLLVLL